MKDKKIERMIEKLLEGYDKTFKTFKTEYSENRYKLYETLDDYYQMQMTKYEELMDLNDRIISDLEALLEYD